MPLPIAHGLFGASLVALVHPKAGLKNWKPLLFGFVLANAADFDFAFSFIFGWRGFHRGFTHSLLFAIIVGIVFCVVWRKETRRAPLAFSLAFLSHTFLDFACGTVGGVRLFLPFNDESFRLGLISFSEFSHGFPLNEILRWSLLEILFFTPIFVLALWFKHEKYI